MCNLNYNLFDLKTEVFKGNERDDPNTPQIRQVIWVNYERIEKAIISLRNRKSPEQNGIGNELFKNGGQQLNEKPTKLNKEIFSHCKITDSGK